MLPAVAPSAWRFMLLASAAPCLLVAAVANYHARVAALARQSWLQGTCRANRSAKLGRSIRVPGEPLAVAVRSGRWRQLFSARWRIRTLIGCTFFVCQVIPYFAVGTFVTQVMSALHIRGGYVGGLIYNLSLFAGAIAGLAIVDRISRRSFLIGSFAAAALTMLPLACGRTHRRSDGVLFAVFAGVLSAASNLCYVYLPELFPTDLRASGIGLAIAASRIGSAASTFLLPVMVSVLGVRTALGACMAVLAAGALFATPSRPRRAMQVSKRSISRRRSDRRKKCKNKGRNSPALQFYCKSAVAPGGPP